MYRSFTFFLYIYFFCGIFVVIAFYNLSTFVNEGSFPQSVCENYIKVDLLIYCNTNNDCASSMPLHRLHVCGALT